MSDMIIDRGQFCFRYVNPYTNTEVARGPPGTPRAARGKAITSVRMLRNPAQARWDSQLTQCGTLYGRLWWVFKVSYRRDCPLGLSPNNGPSVLVIGGSGAVGRPLVDEFLKQKSKFQRIAVLSDPAKVAMFAYVQKKGVEVVVGSFLDSRSYQGFDVVISLAGNSAMKLQPGIIEAAIAGGVRHFYPSEFGGDISVGDFWQNRYFRDKVVTRDHLVAKAKEYPDFRYTLVLTGPFTEYAVSMGSTLRSTRSSRTGSRGLSSALLRWLIRPHPIRPKSEREAVQSSRRQSDLGAAHSGPRRHTGCRIQAEVPRPTRGGVKQEAARKNKDEEAEVFWAGKAIMLNGSGVIPDPLDTAKFSFTPETAKETLRRLFGEK
ncbi:hypothetical protein B0H10DRAFT_1964349 [Mycena sp. CBHHK59/15]|nr:hypothetical protein B0H10DRAFT_1964349 [Mycena sp. CBHHK59/15]